MFGSRLILFCLSLLLLTSCQAAESQKTFQVKGVVQELPADGKTVVIKHEDIPNYMKAMTMPFDVKNTNELRGLKPGDAISFCMIVNATEGWIDHIAKLNQSPQEIPSRSSVRMVPVVEELEPGDVLPDHHFTNELGRAVSLSDFKGKAVAITFFFTSCPFPNFCPRMSSNFAETAAKLSARPDAGKNWHLLSVSFDPENDTPKKLKAYAKMEHYHPAQWSFLTGDPAEITMLSDHFGEKFWHEGATISHNLRTVVIDPNGRVQKIIPNSQWTSDELVAEMTKAMKIKP